MSEDTPESLVAPVVGVPDLSQLDGGVGALDAEFPHDPDDPDDPEDCAKASGANAANTDEGEDPGLDERGDEMESKEGKFEGAVLRLYIPGLFSVIAVSV